MLKKLMNGELMVKSVDKKSDAWANFGVVSDVNGNEIDFVSCKKCNHVMSHKKSSGTSGMKRHACSILARGQPVLTGAAARIFPPAFQSKKTAPSQQIKDLVTSACVDFCSEDLRPFDVVGGKGFSQLLDVVCNPIIGSLFKSLCLCVSYSRVKWNRVGK